MATTPASGALCPQAPLPMFVGTCPLPDAILSPGRKAGRQRCPLKDDMLGLRLNDTHTAQHQCAAAPALTDLPSDSCRQVSNEHRSMDKAGVVTARPPAAQAQVVPKDRELPLPPTRKRGPVRACAGTEDLRKRWH